MRRFSLTLDPDKFLTVCGKCGGEIELYDVKEMQERISTGNVLEDETLAAMATKLLDVTNKVQSGLPTDRPLFACVECLQPYWWNSKESSSPARAMRMAEKLYNTVQLHLAKQSSEEEPMVTVSDKSLRKVEAIGKIDVESNMTDLNSMFAKRDKFVGSSSSPLMLGYSNDSVVIDTNSTTDLTTSDPLSSLSTQHRLHLTSAFARKHSGAEPVTTNWCEEFSG